MTAEQIIRRLIELLEYRRVIMEAQEDLVAFCKFTMPDPRYPNDPRKTRYIPGQHHGLMSDYCMRIERGEERKVIMNTPPRHGKTELCTKRFSAWYSGRNPAKDVMVTTYNEKFAADFGKEVMELIDSHRFRQVFPDYYLTQRANEHMRTYMGGDLFFLGRRSSTTGRGGDLILVDDPTKDDREIKYSTFREDCWQWFTQTLLTRRHNDKAPIMVTQCMTGDTPILRPDGSETPLSEIRPGDMVATYEGGVLKSTKVTKTSCFHPDAILKMRTSSGRTVRANARHPFLVRSEGGYLEWRRMGMLKKGDATLRVITENGRALSARLTGVSNPLAAKASAPLTTESGSGQAGTGHRRSILSAVARRTSSSVMGLLSSSMTAWRQSRVEFAQFATPYPTASLTIGGKSSASIIATTAARFGGFFAMTAISLSKSIWTQTNLSEPLHTSDFTADPVESIVHDGFEPVYDITVERTENFIANGLVSHNTRWHEDDIVGRITDKTNPAYSEKFSKGFKIINLPALAEEDDRLGRKPGEPLWPERFGVEYLEEMREANALSFAALYQCDPTPEDGVYYRTEELHEYDSGELPSNLRVFVVSDHAVATKNWNDPSCLVPFGIDGEGTAWILPKIVWRRMDASETVEEMLAIIEAQKPIFWYAEKGHITKSIGPFLQKRMQETGIYCPIIEEQPVGDKLQRAHSGRARCAQGKIMFPRFAPWWPRAKSELLKFPNGRFDDFVDIISMIGLKLGVHTGPGAQRTEQRDKPGSFGHLLKQFREQDHKDRFRQERAGW